VNEWLNDHLMNEYTNEFTSELMSRLIMKWINESIIGTMNFVNLKMQRMIEHIVKNDIYICEFCWTFTKISYLFSNESNHNLSSYCNYIRECVDNYTIHQNPCIIGLSNWRKNNTPASSCDWLMIITEITYCVVTVMCRLLSSPSDWFWSFANNNV